MAASCGPVAGVMVVTRIRPSELGLTGVKEAMPWVFFSAEVTSSEIRSAGVCALLTSTTVTTGPFAPVPKPWPSACAIQSYAVRVLLPGRSAPASTWPRRMDSSGTEHTARTAAPRARNVQGRRATSPA